MFAKLQIGDLGVVSGIHRRAVPGHGMIQPFLVERLIGIEDETLFAARHGLARFRKFAGDVANQGEFEVS